MKTKNTISTISYEIKDKTEFYLQADDGRIVRIWEGTGDNLLEEDIELGYVDYINYEIYDTMQDIYDQVYDGGMVLLKQYYKDLTLKEIIDYVADMENITFRKGVK